MGFEREMEGRLKVQALRVPKEGFPGLILFLIPEFPDDPFSPIFATARATCVCCPHPVP